MKTLVASNDVATRVVFTGEAMSLAAGAVVSEGLGPLAFSNELAAAGSVALIGRKVSVVYGSYEKNIRTGEGAAEELAWQISGTQRLI